MRTAKADEDAYLLYLQKREEARIGDALDQQRILNVAIVEPPVPPALPVHSVLLYLLRPRGCRSCSALDLPLLRSTSTRPSARRLKRTAPRCACARMAARAVGVRDSRAAQQGAEGHESIFGELLEPCCSRASVACLRLPGRSGHRLVWKKRAKIERGVALSLRDEQITAWSNNSSCSVNGDRYGMSVSRPWKRRL